MIGVKTGFNPPPYWLARVLIDAVVFPRFYMRMTNPYVIVLRLRTLDELFSRFDPSPFLSRDLADEVVDFIVESARDAPPGSNFRIEINVPDAVLGKDDEPLTATNAFFAYMADRQRRSLWRLLAEGRSALLAGVLFLSACTILGQAATNWPGGNIGVTIREGLAILGWVANWRPVQIFLYEWRPLRERIKLFERLAAAPVAVVAHDSIQT